MLEEGAGPGAGQERRNLSDFWRHDRSDDRGQELVSVLQGADILIGNMGSDIRVTWSGMGLSFTNLQKRIVALDYGPLEDKGCPFPGPAVDEVVGYAAHEGGHCLWSEPWAEEEIRELVLTRWSVLPPALQQDWLRDQRSVVAALFRLQNILEDAYVDHHVAQRWPVLGEYLRVARRKLHERNHVDRDAIAITDDPDRNAVIDIWVSVSLYNQHLPPQRSAPVDRVLSALLALTLRSIGEESAGARHTLSMPAAVALWQDFSVKETRLSPELEKLVGKERKLDDFDNVGAPLDRGRQVVQLPKDLMDRVIETRARQVEDISQAVAQALGEDPRKVAATAKKAKYDPERAMTVISQVEPIVRDISEAFQRHRESRSGWLHGLTHGRLDDRRLWKPSVGDNNYFKRKEVIGRPSLTVGLLLDVSGSMKAHMPIIEQTAAVFSQGLMDVQGVEVAIWCYTGKGANVALTRVFDQFVRKLCLGEIQQGGGTPSGAAIAAAQVFLSHARGKTKLLIHFTDGRPDSAAHVIRAVNSCRDADIHVHAIGLPQHRDMLSSQYGEDCFEAIEEVPQLPHATARIVKKLSGPMEGPSLAALL